MAKSAEHAAEMPKELQEQDTKLTLLRQRLKDGDPAISTEELVEMIERAKQKRLALLHAQRPRAKADARRVYAALPDIARKYQRQIARGLSGDPAEAAKAREILLLPLLASIPRLQARRYPRAAATK